jgi:16S rRNA (cytidine1402-2'-O)-methyltransferase
MPTNEERHNRQNLHYSTDPTQRARISMIATPIGNLKDITARALETLQNCDELWCEDTRHTQNLLNALQIEGKRFRRVDQHTPPAEIISLLERVSEQGQHIGVVTDAGTPGISDPGAKVVELAMQISSPGSIRIEAIPGPSAVSAFVSIAAFADNSFLFQGFFPREEKPGLQLLSDLIETELTRNFIFFESPNRIRETIELLKRWSEALDFSPRFLLAKELSKIHETIYSGNGADFLSHLLEQHFDERGEWVFSVMIPKSYVKIKKDQADWALTLECLISSGISTKDASALISQRFSVAKKLAYQSALEMQKKVKKDESKA